MAEKSSQPLEQQRSELEQLKSWEHELEVLGEIEAELEVELISAEVALKSATVKGEFEIDAARAEAIAESLIRKRELEHAIAGPGDRSAEGGSSREEQIARLKSAQEALGDWLKADRSAASWRRPRVAYAIVGIATAAAVWAALAVHLMLLVLLLPLAMALSYLMFTERDADWIRIGAARRFRLASIPPPASWETASVESRLSDLDAELASAEAQRDESDDDDNRQADESDTPKASELKLAIELVNANDQLNAALAEAGLEANQIDSTLAGWLQLVSEKARIRDELAEAKKKRKALNRSAEDSREAIFRFLALNDEAPPHGKADVEALALGLERLEKRKSGGPNTAH